jgi:membrane-associated phospholipid phosphatase
MSTGNHYWLDVVVGVAIAGVAYLIVRSPRPALRHG